MTSRGEHIRIDKGTLVKDHYEVVTSIGSGNFSKVYRVIDLRLPTREQRRNPLAMKVIKKEYSSDAKYEKQMLIILHEHDKSRSARVSKMYECFVWQDCPVFIMPLHGPCLRSRRLGLNRGVVTHEKLLELSYDLLETMAFVHFQCHMVHTDLKPENILIADRGVAENSLGDEWVVCDFGSASLWRMDKLDSDLISTRPYRAPEVLLGNKWHYAADMWSVGCILYEVAVGHRLFENRDDLTHLHMMDRRVGRLPEAFSKHSKYSSKYFNSRGDFLSTPEVIRFSKCRLTPIRDMFKDDREFLHLLKGLLRYNPNERMTAAEALDLPIFDRIRADRKERQRQAQTAAEERRQCCRSPRAEAPGDGTSPRLTGQSDHNTLEHTTTDAKNGHSLHGHHNQNATSDEAGNKKVESRRLEDATHAEANPARGSAAASPTLGSSSKFGSQAFAGTPRDAVATATVATTSPALETFEDKNRFASPSAAVLSSTQPSKKRGFKAAKVLGRAASMPLLQSCSSHNSGSLSSRTPVVSKEVSRQRPCVNSHRFTSTKQTALVPKLALHCIKTSTQAPDHDAVPLSSKRGQCGSERSGRKCSGRSMSPPNETGKVNPHRGTSAGSKHGCGSSATCCDGTRLDVSSPLRSPCQCAHVGLDSAQRPNCTPLRSSATPCHPLETLSSVVTRSPRMTVDASSAAGLCSGYSSCISGITNTPLKQAFRAGTPRSSSAGVRSPRNPAMALGSRSQNSAAKEGEAGAATPLRLESSVAELKALPLPAAATVTTAPLQPSLSPKAPLGCQAPLQRGVRVMSKDTRRELPAMQGTPGADDKCLNVGNASKGRSGRGTGGYASNKGNHDCKPVESQVVTSLAVMKGDDPVTIGGGSSDNDNASLASPNAKIRISVASPTSERYLNSWCNSEASPCSTDYRSPVRCRPPVEITTEDTSGVSSPVMMNKSTACLSISSSECRTVEAAPGKTLAAAMVKRGPQNFATAAATRLVLPKHKSSPSQGGGELYSPREFSSSARLLSSRKSPQFTTEGFVTSPTAVPTVESKENPHELFSTVPLSRALMSSANNGSGTFGDTRNAELAASSVHLRPHLSPLPMGSTSAVVRSTRELPAARKSPSATIASTCTAPTHMQQAPSSASQFAMVTASVDRLKSVPPSDDSDIRGTASPMKALGRTSADLERTPAIAASAHAPVLSPAEESIPMTLMRPMTPLHLPVGVPHTLEQSLPKEKGSLANSDTIASPPLLPAPVTTSTGATGTAGVPHLSPNHSYQQVHGYVHSSGGNSNTLLEAKTDEAGCTTASKPQGLHMPQKSLLPRDHTPTRGMSSPLPAIAAVAPATVTPAFTLSNKGHRAGEQHDASPHNSASRSNRVKSLGVQHPFTSPAPSPRPPPSSSSVIISSDVTAGAKRSASTTTTLSNAGSSSRLNSNCNRGGTDKSGHATPRNSAATLGFSGSTSSQAVQRSPRNVVIPGTSNTNSLRSSTDGLRAGSVRSPHRVISAATLSKTSVTRKRAGSPCGNPPALMTTSSSINAIREEVMPISTVPPSVQPHYQLTSHTQAQQQPSTTVASTGACSGKSSMSIVRPNTRSGIAPTRSSLNQQPSGTPVEVTPRRNASDSSPESVSLRSTATSISLPKQSRTTSSGAVKAVSSSGSAANAPVNTTDVDALSISTGSQPKHRRNPRTLRRITAPRPSTSSLS
ncbi:protein kinase-like protein [Leishmania tarentolae]|uniref:Protein kinase-like protein n=1 Tax=Leishmania tarentolae TaxID=5689 RepID=A0A640KKP2_LEITA|nr:protein kinase-like protein [Leishmania tarentolae]